MYKHIEGYIETKRNGKRSLLHRDIMSEFLGRELLPGEVVHHINGNKNDNRIENLQLITNSQHSSQHHKLTKYINMVCDVCGVSYKRPMREYKNQIKRGQKVFVCSKHCAGQLTKKYLKH